MTYPKFVLATAFVVSLLTGCTDKEICEPAPELGELFDIPAYQYSLNHYFIDTSYISLYEPYYQSIPPMLTPSSQVVEAEVWIQRHGTNPDPNDRFGIAWMHLPSRPLAGYDSSFRLAAHQSGVVEPAWFYQLHGAFFQLLANGYLGVVSFTFPTVPDVTFGISYKRADGTQYGDFLRNGSADTTAPPMVLKMVKPRDLFTAGPRYKSAWQMLIKSVYSLGPHHVSHHGFVLDVVRTPQGGEVTNALYWYPLLRIMGLDRFLATGAQTPQGDGMFDFRPNITIRQEFGEIIFPSLRPFDTDMRTFFTDHNTFIPDSSVLYPLLYDTTQSVARQFNTNQYSIRGKAIFD